MSSGASRHHSPVAAWTACQPLTPISTKGFCDLGLPHSFNRPSFASRSVANISHVLARSDHTFLASGLFAVCAIRTQSSACWRHLLGSTGMRVISPLQKKPRPRWIHLTGLPNQRGDRRVRPPRADSNSTLVQKKRPQERAYPDRHTVHRQVECR
jgi:hypothetical protein